MRILEISILTCALILLIALLVSILCYTRIRLAEIKACGNFKPEHGDEGRTQELAKPFPGSVDEGVENIMTYSVGAKAGDSL
ncbi:hypothetical protein [Oscillibacter sp.]|uniref:hypothetical protein n=1 Tax=Oscillibacter sp. TaxID=1945593 RepID=UPI00289E9164|nr:hypothetical protein [Oscillibacter sp.]